MTKAKKEAAGTAPAANIEEPAAAAPAPAAPADKVDANGEQQLPMDGTAHAGEAGGDATSLPDASGAGGEQLLFPQGLFVAVRSVSQKGRYRIGRFFTPEPVRILLADLSDEEKEELAGDSDLICQLIDAD